MPSNLRKQWQVELEEKFDIDSLIVDSSNWEDYLAKVKSKQCSNYCFLPLCLKKKSRVRKDSLGFLCI